MRGDPNSNSSRDYALCLAIDECTINLSVSISMYACICEGSDGDGKGYLLEYGCESGAAQSFLRR